MAEQEACANAVSEALESAPADGAAEGGPEARGESLLLPLLQGLLGGGGARLLAGLGAANEDVVADVRRSLARLRSALQAPPAPAPAPSPGPPPAPAHPQAAALLALADRLEDALDAADRLDGCKRRPRRRSRAARHTVGVTHEHLQEARRMLDRDELERAEAADDKPEADKPAQPETPSGEAASVEDKEVEEVSYHSAVESRPKPAPVAHSVSCEAAPVSRVERRAPHARKPDFYRHSTGDAGQENRRPETSSIAKIANKFNAQPQETPPPIRRPPLTKQISNGHQNQIPNVAQNHPTGPQNHTQNGAQNYTSNGPQNHMPNAPQNYVQNGAQNHVFNNGPQYNNMSNGPQYHPNVPQNYVSHGPQSQNHQINRYNGPMNVGNQSNINVNSFLNQQQTAPQANGGFIQKKQAPREEPRVKAPLYVPLPPGYNFAAPPATEEVSKPLSRFNSSKRNRMKRANTIDIGRPMAGYRIDSDTDDDGPRRGPIVPEFQPQTENDKKFVAFMKKNEENGIGNGHSNWSNRFGNIKNAFESRDRDDRSRSSSTSSQARKYWQAAEDPATHAPRRTLPEANSKIIKPPWVAERRPRIPTNTYQSHPQSQPPVQSPVYPPYNAPVQSLPHAPQHAPPHPPPPAAHPGPPHHASHPPIPQSPTRPTVVKPFVARPIPVNQFSHAPMSAFKPPNKATSPTTPPAHIWSPPSTAVVSPSLEYPPPPGPIGAKSFAPNPSAAAAWSSVDPDRSRRAYGPYGQNKNEIPSGPPQRHASYNPPTPPSYATSPIPSYPVKSIPSQTNLAAPELVKKMSDPRKDSFPKVDAQKLQIEFYEKQIRDKARQEISPAPGKPPASPAQPGDVTAAFVPLQQTPDIEKARAHKVDYLPDVVITDGAPAPPSPPTEHCSVVTRVMRGPVRGAATVTPGVRTRGDDERGRDALRGALHRAAPRRQVRPAPAPHAPAAPCTEPASPPPPASPLGRSGSWHRLDAPPPPKPTSPRRVVSRTKSLHLLAVPKLFEGGIESAQLPQKRRSVEAYFAGQTGQTGEAAPTGQPAPARGFALARSRTAPAVQLLDESNADDAFEHLVSALA